MRATPLPGRAGTASVSSPANSWRLLPASGCPARLRSSSHRNQYIAHGFGQDLFGDTANQQRFQQVYPMLAHDDQIAIPLLFLLDDAQSRVAVKRSRQRTEVARREQLVPPTLRR